MSNPPDERNARGPRRATDQSGEQPTPAEATEAAQPTPSAGGGERERLVLWQRAAKSTASEADAASWGRAVSTRLQVAGGELVARAGTSVVASFDPLEIEDAIDLALDLLADAGNDAAGLEVTCGLALGEVASSGEPAALSGTVIDRALLLASFAQAGELVLDEAAHARAQEIYLFTRGLRAATCVGHVLDAAMPRKRDCRRALSALHPSPAPTQAGYVRLRELAAQEGSSRVALRSAHGHAALDWIARLAAELEPEVVLHLGRRASGLQPLGSLQLALLRAGSAAMPALEPAHEDALAALHEGAAVSRGGALDALRAFLADRRAFVVLDRAREIDAPSLAVTLEALASSQSNAVLLAITDDQGLPGVIARSGDVVDIAVEPTAHDERTRIAEAVLGASPGVDIAQRVARLGGDTAPGIVQAARTLVCAGDLVLDAGAFRWRTRPRLGALPIPVDALLTERAAGLDPSARRVLEALCIAPQALARDALAAVAALDGLSADATAQGIEQLETEGWLERGPLAAMETVIRSALRNGMPPARAAELHRFVADVLQERMPAPGPAFGRALIAHHLAEGGREREAAAALLDAAQAATETGFDRMAVRLAAIALKLDASGETKVRARKLARRVDTNPHAGTATAPHAASESPEPAQPARAEEAHDPRQLATTAVRAAIRAIVRGDVDATESLVDTAVAAGWGRAAAQRLWAIALLKKGDVPAAVRALKQVHTADAGPSTRAREAITAALILVESGEPVEAVRAALDGLAVARRANDASGERAALHVLAACYRMMGREHDAERIDAVATSAAA